MYSQKYTEENKIIKNKTNESKAPTPHQVIMSTKMLKAKSLAEKWCSVTNSDHTTSPSSIVMTTLLADDLSSNPVSFC